MGYTEKDILGAKTRKDLKEIAKHKKIDISNTLKNLGYLTELNVLQSELVYLQQWINKKKLRVAVIFEGARCSR